MSLLLNHEIQSNVGVREEGMTFCWVGKQAVPFRGDDYDRIRSTDGGGYHLLNCESNFAGLYCLLWHSPWIQFEQDTSYFYSLNWIFFILLRRVDCFHSLHFTPTRRERG